MAQTTQPTAEDRNRVPKIKAAFAESTQLQAMFPSLDAFVGHMLKADYETSEQHQAAFPDVASFAAYSRWAETH